MTTITPLATRITEARRAKGLTQQALAEAIGCAVRTVQNWEAGERTVSAQLVVPAAKALGLPVADLLGGNMPC